MSYNKGNSEIQYIQTSDLIRDAKCIISEAQQFAYQVVNVTLVKRNWMLGKRIAEEELKGTNRAEYGNAIIQKLADELTAEFGKGFDYSSLYKFVRFYKLFPNILDSVSTKSSIILSFYLQHPKDNQ